MSAELHFRIVSARNLKDVQTFGRQDPYVKVTVGNRQFKTKVHDNGGTTPYWNEKFVFQVRDPQLNQVHLEVKDKDLASSKFIGECRIPISMFSHGQVVDQWFALNRGHHGKSAGEINIRAQLFINNAVMPGANPTQQQMPVTQNRSTSGYPGQVARQTQRMQAPAAQQYASAPAPRYNSAPSAPSAPATQSYAPAPQQQYAPPPQQYAAPPQQVYQQPAPQVVYQQPQPQVVVQQAAPRTVVQPQYRHNQYGHHGRSVQRGGMDPMMAGGLGLLGGVLLGSALGDDD